MLLKQTRKALVNTIGVVGLFLLVFANAHAQDDLLLSKPSLMWLSDDVSLSAFDQASEYQSFLGKSEAWSDKWGVSASLLQNNDDDVFGLPKDSEYINLDVKRRFGSHEKRSLDIGLGWQELNVQSQIEASGPKLSLEGKVSLFDDFQVYGTTAWLPDLDDNLNESNASAYELEAGVLFQPLPSVSLRAGYRHFSLDTDDDLIEQLGSSSGFLLGTDLSW